MIAMLALAGCQNQRVTTVESFRYAREAGDFDTAQGYLSRDPLVRREQRDGKGSAWNLGGGSWKAWDEHFNSDSNLGPWHVEGDTVWAVATETNDYFRLIEREDVSRYRVTYFFDDEDRIEGFMISAAYPDRPKKPSVSRIDEIEAWVLEHDPQEWAYLRPGGKLDPTGDRAERTRALINRWRAELGLAPIEWRAAGFSQGPL